MSYREKKYQSVYLNFEGNIAILTFNRPETMNYCCPEMAREYQEILNAIDCDSQVSVVITTGNEKAYCSGGRFAARRTSGLLSETDYTAPLWSRKLRVAMISGCCWGGGLAQAISCDLRIASPNASFRLLESRDAVLENPALIPLMSSRRPVVTPGGEIGKKWDAVTAHQKGYVNMIVPQDALRETTVGLARMIGGRGVQLSDINLAAV